MQTRTYLSDNLTPHLSGYDGWEERWIEAFASHAERRFETRALVKASIHGGDPVSLAYIFALHGGGLVLVAAAEEEGEGGHDDDNAHGDYGDHEAEAADAAARAERELWSRMRGAGQREIWISRPDQAVFHVVRPEEGAFSTGFGRLGMSRTPDLILPRSTVTPVRKLHPDHF